MRHDLPGGTVTFLFTDVEGSTRLLYELGPDAYADALAEHRRVVREACVNHAGVEVDTQGDAFFVVFPTAPGALEAARAITEELVSGPIRVRVGLHTGTPLLTEDGYVGTDVHRAARIASSGHGGQVLVSPSTAALTGTADLMDLGEHRFKDLAARERVYQLGDQDFPPLKSLNQTNLPVPATSFLGRERELYEVARLLARDDLRVLTLTGPGGTGKTRLAAQAAGLASEDYPDGLWWVPLAALREPELVLASAAQALGARDELASHIADKRMLILFDNFEQVVQAACDLAELVSTCPSLDLLVTSREPLHISGEQEYPVPSFAPEEGVSFFLARARAVKPDFEGNGAVSLICRRLDDLPLALELAAARVKALSPDKILERLGQRLPLLTSGTRDAPERQRTLNATIAWSYDRLSEDEQRLFRRLSVFAGGCTLEAAEEVCDADLDPLQSLVDKSLARHTDDRYWMLETIREFAAERLGDAGEAAELRQRHADWVLKLAEQAESGMEGPEALSWHSRLEQEQDNLRAALAFLDENGQTDMQVELVGRIWEFWDYAGTYLEGLRWAEAALSRSQAERGAPRAKALRSAAVCAGRLGNLVDGKAYAEESLSIFRELGDAKHIAWALNISGLVSGELGDEAEAERLFDQVRVQALKAGEARIAAFATANLGDHALRRGDYTRATALTEDALALFRELGLERERAWALHNLAICLLLSGQEQEAIVAATESLTLSGDLFYRTLTLALLGSVAARRGDPEAGTRVLAAAGAAWERSSLTPTGAEAELYHETVEELRATLGQGRYNAAFTEGQTMALEEAVEYALRTLE